MANFVNGKDCLINLDLVQQVKYDLPNLRITFMLNDSRSEMENYASQQTYDDAKAQIDSLIVTLT